jgi:hypothetical protein
VFHEVFHASPQKGVMGEESKHPITGVLGSLSSQKVLLRDGSDGDEVCVHVDTTVLPDEGQAACVRADMEPVSLCTAVDLWGQSVQGVTRGRGFTAGSQAQSRWGGLKPASFPKKLCGPKPCFANFPNLPPHSNFSSKKFTAIIINGRILAVFKDFMKLFLFKNERHEKINKRLSRVVTMNCMSHSLTWVHVNHKFETLKEASKTSPPNAKKWIRKKFRSWVSLAHTCSPNYLGGSDWKDLISIFRFKKKSKTLSPK